MVERGGLENRCASNRTVGSNPTLSASPEVLSCARDTVSIFLEDKSKICYLTQERGERNFMDLITTVSSKGQVTIPKTIREELGLHQGSRLLFRLNKDAILEVQPLRRSIDMFCGRGKRLHPAKILSLDDIDAAIAEAVTKND